MTQETNENSLGRKPVLDLPADVELKYSGQFNFTAERQV
jgi:hypothetical protein